MQDPTIKSGTSKSEAPKSEAPKSVSPTSQNTSAPTTSASSNSKPDGAASSNPKSEAGDHHDPHARTRHRAYLNFLDRQQNSHHGDEHSDWLRAEQQIREEHERNQAPQSQPKSEVELQSQGIRKDDAYKSAKA